MIFQAKTSLWILREAVISMSSTYSGLHSGIVGAVGRQLAGTENSSRMYTLGCKLMEMTDSISFYFSGVEIQVSVRDLVKKISDTCYLTFVPTQGLIDVGQDILKSAYVVVNMDNSEVGLAQATPTTKSVIVEEIGSLIPLATQAPLSNYTDLEEKLQLRRVVYFDLSGGECTCLLHEYGGV